MIQTFYSIQRRTLVIGNSMDRFSKYPDGNDDLEFAVFDMFSAMSGGYVFKMIASPCETVNGPFSIEDRKNWGIIKNILLL
jgi:hypothetical protein